MLTPLSGIYFIDITRVLCYIKTMQASKAYDHLAEVYLDSAKKNPQVKRQPAKKFLFIPIGIIVVFLISISAFALLQKKAVLATGAKEFALIIEPALAIINFDFFFAKKESLSYDLAGADLRNYEYLVFSLRYPGSDNGLHLRLELSNQRGERAEFYLQDVPGSWREFKIGLADFSGMSSRANMAELKFTLEDWNVKEQVGRVFIENIRFLK